MIGTKLDPRFVRACRVNRALNTRHVDPDPSGRLPSKAIKGLRPGDPRRGMFRSEGRWYPILGDVRIDEKSRR